ncbi:zinc finger domain-containing protein [Streptomyces avermitilis]|uniref:zinc finger domain-containing protein n=1 Tax=Streptomyces avermitilis TaxID=33903 RepID=UPI00381DB9EE
MLPLEAIELDAFRRRHEDDTFWCGLLLGGCGLQLTTKLYTDRVCHFAHRPGPDGHPHVCGRHSRGVSSADHLYVKSAATAWLRGRDEQADFYFARPDGAAIGSVVDIRFKARGLRVHLDPAVEPVWDEDGREPVLGLSVRVDRDTLIGRWYVHRIRLDNEGTSRRVRIGTEAFARSTEWFGLDECEMTERGLSTPAVERIIQARSVPPPSRWSPGKARKVPEPDARAQGLLRRLLYARRVNSVVMAMQVCREIADLTGVSQEIQGQLEAAVRHAHVWLEEQAGVRRRLFARLDQAVADQRAGQVRRLLVRVNATASHDRTEAEDAIVERAIDYFAGLDNLTQEAVEAEAAAERATAEAAARVRTLLKGLRRYDAYMNDLHPQVEALIRSAAAAGDRLTAGQARDIATWKTRAADGVRLTPIPRVARRYWIERSCPRCHAAQGKDCILAEGTDAGKVRKSPHDERLQPIVDERKAQQAARSQPEGRHSKPGQLLHQQVARRYWIKKNCPRCQAVAGKNCVENSWTGTGTVSKIPHDDRLEPILAERKAKAERQRLTPGAYDIACPDCARLAGERCASPSGGVHRSRVERAQKVSRGNFAVGPEPGPVD